MTAHMFILIQIGNELSEYIDIFPGIYNPIFVSGIILIIVLLLIYVSYRHVYNPLLRKHKYEQEQYEIKTAKLLAQFSELDPNPILRIDNSGTIIGMNNSARLIFDSVKINQTKIDADLGITDIDIPAAIRSDKHLVISKQVGNNHYEINFHGVSLLKMAQLYFWDVTLKKEFDDQMKSYQVLLKNVSAYLQKTQDEERKRISQELHDSIGQNLLLVKLNIIKYKKFIPLGIDESEYNRTMEILDSAITKVREVAHNLKPINLENLGLVTLIKSMCRDVSRETGLKYQLQLPDSTGELTRDIEMCIYRVVQESLNNIIRHAKSKDFEVSLSLNETSSVLRIADSGIGFNPQKLLDDKYVSDGIGIMSMQENVERLNGRFRIESSLNMGTTVIVTFPIVRKDHDAKQTYKNSGS